MNVSPWANGPETKSASAGKIDIVPNDRNAGC
jgi:hypothetical protein